MSGRCGWARGGVGTAGWGGGGVGGAKAAIEFGEVGCGLGSGGVGGVGGGDCTMDGGVASTIGGGAGAGGAVEIGAWGTCVGLSEMLGDGGDRPSLVTGGNGGCGFC